MRAPLLLLPLLLYATPVFAQNAQLEVSNYRGVVSTATHATTGANYPWGPTTPPGYTGTGVAAGSRCWIYVPRTRFTGGHQQPNYMTVTGMKMTIMIGAATTTFNKVYQFGTGIAPAGVVAKPHGFEHDPNGPDIVSFPPAPIVVTSITNFRHTFATTTPIAVPDSELLLFVEYQGGEQQDSPDLGQTLAADWRGGTTMVGVDGQNYGFTVGAPPRTVTLSTDPLFNGQIGMIIDEPFLCATGWHGNNNYASPPLANETFTGIAASRSSFASGNATTGESLFFYLSGGTSNANGTATVLFNWTQSSFAGKVPTPFGNLLLSPFDPMLTAFADSGFVMLLDPQGDYTDGPNNALSVPVLGPAALGYYFDFQGVVLHGSGQTIQLTSRSGIHVRN